VRLDHQRQTVGRNGGQSSQSWFSNPYEQVRAYELGSGAGRVDRDDAGGFCQEPNLYVYAGEERII
jgi:hypothetical protein